MSEWGSIAITKIVDYLFSPQTLYNRLSYDSLEQEVYYSSRQKEGEFMHATIEDKSYSNRKKYLMGISVGSEEYGIHGKIDIYDKEKFLLIERKRITNRLSKLSKTQLFAEYVCMKEMGYRVDWLQVRSMKDNQSYTFSPPTPADLMDLQRLIYHISHTPDHIIKLSSSQSDNSIYQALSL